MVSHSNTGQTTIDSRNRSAPQGSTMGSRPARHRYCRCGTHLAADNKEHQCARCQRASREAPRPSHAPPQAPAEFWQSEQLREAFTAQHIGRVARAYRMHPHHHAVYGPSGISQTLLGQWLGLRQPQISRIEAGAPIRDLAPGLLGASTADSTQVVVVSVSRREAPACGRRAGGQLSRNVFLKRGAGGAG